MSRFYSPYYYNKQKLNCKIIMNIFENLTAFPQFRVIFTLKKQDYSCSTVSLHKPCSVLQWSGSHLSAFFQTPHRMISLHLQQVPLPNLGFSLAGFTRSIFPVSRKARLCGTFKGVRHSFHHRPSPAVSLRCLDLSFHPAQTLHPSQNVRAWTFL